MKSDKINKIRELTNLASKDLFWTKAKSRSQIRAAFESSYRRGKMQTLINDILEQPEGSCSDLDVGLRNAANYIEDYGEGCDQTLKENLITYSLQYQRIERCAKQEQAGFYNRVNIYRRIPLNQDPCFTDLKEDLFQQPK